MTVHFPISSTEIEQNKTVRVVPAHIAERPYGIYRHFAKRAFDIVIALVLLPVAFPIIALFALLIARDGHNPFYSQMRVGRNGDSFRMWKLRTMVHNADQRLAECLAQDPRARQEWETTQKLKNDPRITLIGRILRKISADELPQLLNVLNGTMSLVGPRPMMLCQRDSYTGNSYFDLRPGITGLWQVSDRNEGAFIDRVKFDEAYNRALSLKTDFAILLRTIDVVWRGTGY
ncbi:sugar transferase [uncultured Roseobacter sp.]|uniref:sugar transferase n=1 Tax=uncultured Roseobacter sp. TaxID=114847 RepID=UPI00260D8739|nr:sugar transferase [uncultured Roseobacter sp.]